jgi:bifunctional non-homologous end joining protein LigD
VRREHAPLPSVVKRGKRELRLSNLDKPFWPDEGDHEGRPHRLLPGRRGSARPAPARRPFTMKRYPDGWQGKFFFQKQAPTHMPEWIARRPAGVDAGGREEGHRLRAGERRAGAPVDGEHGLHRSARVVVRGRQARTPGLGHVRPRPVRGGDVRGRRRGRRLVKDTLDLLELESFPKTSGSRGIHVLVPVRATAHVRRRTRVRGHRR